MFQKRTARQNDVQHGKWLTYPEPDCPPEEPSTNLWQPKKPFTWCRQTPSFGQVAFPKYTPNLAPTMAIGLNIGSNMPNNMGPSMSQIMPPNMTPIAPNDTYRNMPYPMHVPMMNHDWQRNYEPNMPYWSPEMDGPTSGIQKFRFENPISKIGESSYNNNTMKNNWMQQQQQMCNKRQVQNNEINCPNAMNDQNLFWQYRDITPKKAVVNTNNKPTFKGHWGQSDVHNPFGNINSSKDFEVTYINSQNSQKDFPNARHFNGNPFAYQPDKNVPKVNPEKLPPFPLIEMKKLSKSMENLLKFEENTKNFLTSRKSSDTFRSYETRNSKAVENLFLKDSRIVQNRTPSKLNVQLFPATGSRVIETNTTAVTPCKFTALTEKMSPLKRHVSENNNSKLISKSPKIDAEKIPLLKRHVSENKNSKLISTSPKIDAAADLRHFLIAKRRQLDCDDTKINSGNTAEGNYLFYETK